MNELTNEQKRYLRNLSTLPPYELYKRIRRINLKITFTSENNPLDNNSNKLIWKRDILLSLLFKYADIGYKPSQHYYKYELHIPSLLENRIW